jgi:hypothetical protein
MELVQSSRTLWTVTQGVLARLSPLGLDMERRWRSRMSYAARGRDCRSVIALMPEWAVPFVSGVPFSPRRYAGSIAKAFHEFFCAAGTDCQDLNHAFL